MAAVTTSQQEHPATNAPTAVRVPTAEPENHRADPPDLAQLDQQMAADLDQVLQGNFESIDTVLDEVFDEKAAIVQRTDGSPALENKSQQGGGFAPVNMSGSTEVPGAISVTAGHSAFKPDTVVASIESLPAIENRNNENRPNQTVEEVPAALQKETPTTASPSPLRAAKQTADAPSVEARSTTSSIAIPKPTVPSTGHSSERPARSVAQRLALILSPVRGVLTMMNFPLRFVPRPLRPLVDWAALTLLMWVPIVWTMALLHRD